MFPTWTKLLDRLGQGINLSPWCLENDFAGRDYLVQWIASVYRRPEMRTHPIRIVAEGVKMGASTFHEALSFLVPTLNVQRALESYFNNELRSCSVAVLDDIKALDIRSATKLVRWVDDPTIVIERQANYPLKITNRLHWIEIIHRHGVSFLQTDVVIYLKRRPEPSIPKMELFDALRSEKADFVEYLTNLTLMERLPRL